VTVTFTRSERRFLESNEICHLATASSKGWPLVTPVNYVLMGNSFYVATDFDTTKYRHLKENPKASIVVDTVAPNRAVVVQGRVELIEGGKEFDDVYSAFYERFSWVRDDPWKVGEAPFIKITPTTKSSWA
jgi:nitroimidazol reductase NimA-like FMN-containing flavoprotein (pyridoxamine 5'-phosphate oxidase superfamily)